MFLGWFRILIWLGIESPTYLCHMSQGAAAEYGWEPLKVMLMCSIADLQTLILELLSTNSILFFPVFV